MTQVPQVQDLKANGHSQGVVHAFFQNVVSLVNEIRTGYTADKADANAIRAKLILLGADVTAVRTKLLAAGADIVAIRAVVNNLFTDNANRIANHNTLTTKLNSDAGVTDTNYAAATAAVAAAPAAVTYADPAALTYADPAAISSAALAESALQLTKT